MKIENLSQDATDAIKNTPKPTKKELNALVWSIINSEEVDEGQIKSLLYNVARFFEIKPKQKAGHDKFSWLAHATAGKYDSRRVLQYVKVEESGRAVATDGRRLHIFDRGLNLPAGLYTVNKTRIQEEYNYFNYECTIPKSFEHQAAVTLEDFTIEHEGAGIYAILNDLVFNAQYIQEVFASKEPATIKYNTEREPVLFEFRDSKKAIVMPLREKRQFTRLR